MGQYALEAEARHEARQPDLDRLSNILKRFNDQFGNIPWTYRGRVHRLITEDIPARVAEDPQYQNVCRNSDRQNAKIEHEEALKRVMTAVLKDDTELFKQFMDNDGFRRWMTDSAFGLTTRRQGGPDKRQGVPVASGPRGLSPIRYLRQNDMGVFYSGTAHGRD